MDNVNGKVVACYVYTERGSKNNQGGFASLNQTNKVVRQYEVDKERCHVKILDRYLRVLPHELVTVPCLVVYYLQQQHQRLY